MTPSQWKGWDSYIRRYCSMQTFQKLWFIGTTPQIGWTNEFSADFEQYLENIFVEIGLLTAPTKLPPSNGVSWLLRVGRHIIPKRRI